MHTRRTMLVIKTKKLFIKLLSFQSVPFPQVPYGTHMGPIWEQPKIGKVDILEAIYKKILDEIFLQMRFGST